MEVILNPDVILACTGPRTLSAFLRAHDPRLVDLLRTHGFDIAEESRSTALDTGDASLVGQARRLVADLHMAGFSVGADVSLHPSDIEIEVARRSMMTRALARANTALQAWDSVSDSLCDEEGRPLDEETYGRQCAELGQVAWDAFETFLVHGPTLLEQARRALRHLTGEPERAAQSALSRLHSSLTKGVLVWADGERELALLRNPDGAPRNEAAYAQAVEVRNSEGWHAAYEWMVHGETLVALATAGAELYAAPESSPAPDRAPAPPRTSAAGRPSTGRR